MDAECFESIRRAKLEELLEIKVTVKLFETLVTSFMEHSHTFMESRVHACAAFLAI